MGIGAAILAGRLLATQLFEILLTDPVTYATVAGALALTGFVACSRAGMACHARVDLIIALRNE